MNIKIYTSQTCSWCKKLKEWLKKKRLPFEDHDVTENETDRDEVINKTGQMAVPLIIIDEEMMIGFDEKKLEQIVAMKKGEKKAAKSSVQQALKEDAVK